jgi:crotonobetainyl-CoA:carnitine CoA-transferase CaiB-like acyl-CoA transferase
LFDTSLSMLVNVASNYLISGNRPGRFGNGHANIVPYRDFPCGDGEIALAVGNDEQFARFAACVNHPEWAEDARFRTNPARVENRETLEPLIRDALGAEPARTWIAKFQKEGIPCGRVAPVDEALESEQAKANDMVVEMDHPSAGAIRMLGIPYHFSDTPEAIQSPPPVLGADTDTVLKDLTPLNEGDLATLRAEGVI